MNKKINYGKHSSIKDYKFYNNKTKKIYSCRNDNALHYSLGVLSTEKNPEYLKWSIIIILLLTPLWRYYSVNDNPDPIGQNARKAALFNVGISLVSIWLYININSIQSIQTTGLNIFVKSASVAALILLFFSIAFVPFMERIIFGKPQNMNLLKE